jgi:hypothetical protein
MWEVMSKELCAYSSVSIVVTGGKVTAVFGVALLFNGEVEVCLSNVILTVHFFLGESCSNYTEEAGVVHLTC